MPLKGMFYSGDRILPETKLRKYKCSGTKSVWSFRRSQSLHYSFLNGDKHQQWMDSLLESAPDAVLGDEDDSGAGSKADYTGYVLALNGHKKYFCLFRPVFTGEEADQSRSSDEDAALAGGVSVVSAGTANGTRSRSSQRRCWPTER